MLCKRYCVCKCVSGGHYIYTIFLRWSTKFSRLSPPIELLIHKFCTVSLPTVSKPQIPGKTPIENNITKITKKNNASQSTKYRLIKSKERKKLKRKKGTRKTSSIQIPDKTRAMYVYNKFVAWYDLVVLVPRIKMDSARSNKFPHIDLCVGEWNQPSCPLRKLNGARSLNCFNLINERLACMNWKSTILILSSLSPTMLFSKFDMFLSCCISTCSGLCRCHYAANLKISTFNRFQLPTVTLSNQFSKSISSVTKLKLYFYTCTAHSMNVRRAGTKTNRNHRMQTNLNSFSSVIEWQPKSVKRKY